MPVIVFNKKTGKYLKRHSGSYRNAWTWSRYNKKNQAEILKRLGEAPEYRDKNTDPEGYEIYREYHRKVGQLMSEFLFGAEPEDARVYATEGSATASVGIYNPKRVKKGEKVYKLPDHLELHEIKESFICVIRPDGSSNCDDESA